MFRFTLQLDFTYDYLGRRVQKIVVNLDTSQQTLARRYLYDGWNLVAELNGTGATVQRSYTWGLDVAGTLRAAGGVGALIQITDHGTGTSYAPTYDGNGNVAALINVASGGLAISYEYSPFGEVLRAGAATASTAVDTTIADNPFRFSTKFADLETGLVYYGHRYYSPGLGRFINRDPIEEAGGANLYRFAGNNPVNLWDNLGMEPGQPGTDPQFIPGDPWPTSLFFGATGTATTQVIDGLGGVQDFIRLPARWHTGLNRPPGIAHRPGASNQPTADVGPAVVKSDGQVLTAGPNREVLVIGLLSSPAVKVGVEGVTKGPPPVKIGVIVFVGGYAIGTGIDNLPRIWGGQRISESIADGIYPEARGFHLPEGVRLVYGFILPADLDSALLSEFLEANRTDPNRARQLLREIWDQDSRGRVQGHHGLPQFLGGNFKQILTNLNPGIHGELHAILRENLQKAGIPLDASNTSRGEWQQYLFANPGAQRKAFDAVLDASRAIDIKYGTNVTQDVWRNLMQGNFTPYP